MSEETTDSLYHNTQTSLNFSRCMVVQTQRERALILVLNFLEVQPT